MILELLIIVALIAAIVTLAYYLWKCKQPDDSTTVQMASRAKPMHPGVASYQNFLRSVTLPEYEYKKYEAYTPPSSGKKYGGNRIEDYTLADYDKIERCPCKPMNTSNTGSRGWSPSSDRI